MSCANSGITILSLLIIALTIWQISTSKTIIIIASVLVILMVWTGCKCIWCEKADVIKKKK
ncbi:MAG: hypothetical protein AABX66_02105 [Nanoarchaeota archaeon]